MIDLDKYCPSQNARPEIPLTDKAVTRDLPRPGPFFPLLSRMGGVALPLWAVLVLATAGSASARTRTSARSLDGLWLTDGYREFVEFRGEDMRSYEITALSCIPVVKATRKIEMGAVGEIIFVGEYDTLRISPGPSPETRWLHADGSISNILLRRTDSRPEVCGQPVADTPLTNYQVFWETFAENYPFFALRKMDWLAEDKSFRPQVTPKTTPAELFQILSHMIEPLYDAHTAIRAYSIRQGFRGYRPAMDPMRRKSAARITEIIETNYVRGGLRSYCNKQLQFGLLTGPTQNSRLPDSIGYLRIHSFSRYSDDREFAKQLDALETSLDDIFKDSAKFAGLVIDIRINGGGSDVFGVSIASRLAAHDYLAYSKVARNDVRDPKHRTPPQAVIVHGSSRPGFRGPVVLLTSSDTVSAAETFTMAVLGRQPHVIRVGENTQGVFSDVLNRTLPNGWSFGLPVEIYLTKDGKAFDGLGVPPDIAVPIFTAQDIANGRDSAIDKALELLAPKVK